MTSKTLTGTYASGYSMQLPVTTVTIASSGVVLGSGLIGDASTASTVVNEGKISSAVNRGSGVYLGAGGEVINGGVTNTTALIAGYEAIVAKAPGSVVNYGTVTGSLPYGVAVYFKDGGSLTNGAANDEHALIQGGDGVLVAGASCSVTNFGTINGAMGAYFSTAGIALRAGGVVTNGSAADHGALIEGYSGVYVGVAKGDVTNYGTIKATLHGVGKAGVELRFGGTLVNGAAADSTALIESAGRTVYVSSGTVENFGTILSTGITASVSVSAFGSISNGSAGDTAALERRA